MIQTRHQDRSFLEARLHSHSRTPCHTQASLLEEATLTSSLGCDMKTGDDPSCLQPWLCAEPWGLKRFKKQSNERLWSDWFYHRSALTQACKLATVIRLVLYRAASCCSTCTLTSSSMLYNDMHFQVLSQLSVS